MIETDVLIVGGSLVGLSAATFLAWHGVSTLSVERHHGTAIHPRAGHFHPRTLEVLRSVGLEDRVKAELEKQFDPDGAINAVELLAGKEIATYIANLNAGVAEISPSTRLFMTQQSLEPLIRDRAQELGAAMRYATVRAGQGRRHRLDQKRRHRRDRNSARQIHDCRRRQPQPAPRAARHPHVRPRSAGGVRHHLLPRRLRRGRARPQPWRDLCVQPGAAWIFPSGADRRLQASSR